MSPTPPSNASTAGSISSANSISSRFTVIPQKPYVGEAGDNGQFSATQTLSPLSVTRSPAVGWITPSPSAPREIVSLMSPHAAEFLDSERPALAPKLRDQILVQDIEARSRYSERTANENGDEEEVYNYPKQYYNRPLYTVPHRDDNDEDDYDIPPTLRRRLPVDGSDGDMYYDRLSCSPGNEVHHYNDDSLYDVPTAASVTIRTDHPPPPHVDTASHHSYVNMPSNRTHPTSLGAEPDTGDSEQDCEVGISPRTRSFKSSKNRYVLHLKF